MTTPRWSWLGDPLAIDFANTVRRRGDVYEELLKTPEDLAEWASHEPVPATPRLDEVRAYRDSVFAALEAATQGRPAPAAAEQALNAALAAVPLIPQLRAGEVVLTAPPETEPLDELRARVAHSALELLADPRLALCDAPSCGQFFLRRRGDQLWCGAACGTRARVARHARR